MHDHPIAPVVCSPSEPGRLTSPDPAGRVAADRGEAEVYRLQHASLRKAYEKVRKINRRLDRANRLKAKFFEIVVHDLRNPLSVIRTYTDMLLEGVQSSPGLLKAVVSIRDSSERLERLISYLLRVAELESGLLEVQKTAVDLAQIARSVVNDNQHLAERKGQTFKCSFEKNSHVAADPGQLREIVDNLISNAVKYSPRDKRIRVRVKKGRGCVRFEVTDEGPGLTAEDKNGLFGQFRRLSAQPTGGESSTGLGLFIVRQLVDLHGGRVWAESGSGKGATFIVEFPAPGFSDSCRD